MRTTSQGVPTRPPGRLLAPPTPTIDWATEAAALSVYLPPRLLLVPVYDLLPAATGALIWVPWPPTTAFPLAVHPALLVQTAAAPLHGACVELVLCLPLHDVLHQHIVLVLQAVSAAEDVAGQLYAEALTEALVVHVLRRYAASQAVLSAATGGLPPYKLRRTLAYIQAHLAEKLSLTTLAAVAQMSPSHFAHLFKHATGLAPHQYVLRCRMEHAKRLLASTDLALMDIVHQVGCADHSHFTALFRKHVTMTPKAYRSHAKSKFV